MSATAELPAGLRLEQYAGVWMIEESRARALRDLAALRDWSAHVKARMAAEDPSGDAESDVQMLDGGVALIPIVGIFTKYGSSLSQNPGTLRLRRAVRSAARDPDVRALLLLVDSPGGSALGIDDLAREVAEAARRKPVSAYIEDMGASAAYYVASQARRVVVNAAASVGSIGTFAVVEDVSAAFAREGVRTIIIRAGAFKGAGTPGTEITPAQVENWQREIEAYNDLFLRAVAQGRRLPLERVRELNTGQVWLGREAVRLGLADEVATMDAAYQDLLSNVGDSAEPAGRRRPEQRALPGGDGEPAAAQAAIERELDAWLRVRGHERGNLAPAALAVLREEFLRQSAAAPDAHGAAADPATRRAAADPVAGGDGAEPDGAGDPPSAAARATQAIAAERARVAAIRALGQGLEHVAGVGRLIDCAMSEGWSVETARGRVLDLVRAQGRGASPGSFAIHEGERESTAELLEAGLSLRCGLPVADARLAERAARYSRWSLAEFAAEVLRLHGRAPRGDARETITRALELDRLALDVRGEAPGASTVTVPALFSNVANKSLLAGFEQAPGTALQWATIRETNDFKVQTDVAIGPAGELKPVNDAGDAELDKIDQQWAPTWQVGTYAERLILTRREMINDDLGALADRPRAMGLAAMATIDNLFYRLLLSNPTLGPDSLALFEASTHKNLASGAGSALGSGSLSTAKANMAKQTHLDGVTPLNLMPYYLLVPPELMHTALELVQSSTILLAMAGNSDAQTVRGAANVHMGTLQVLAEPRLSSPGYTGNSATAWYLATRQGVQPSMIVGFLRGRRAPTLTRIETGTVLKIGWEIVLDVGVAAVDYRGIHKSLGS